MNSETAIRPNEDCTGIALTIPARLVNGALVIYYKQATHPVPFGTLLLWNDEEQKDSSMTDDKRVTQHPENRIIPDQLFDLDESGKAIPAGLRFTVPEAGDYKLTIIADCPFLDPI